MKAKKLIAMLMCAVLLVTGTVMGTMAYLTSTDVVKNAFTVGSVKITLDEAKVKPDGTLIAGEARVRENVYHLLPGQSYVKDPTVHVDTTATTDNCWLFVKIANGLAAFESSAEGYKKISAQITENGWTELEEGLYYCEYVKDGAADYKVFEQFSLADNANEINDWEKIAAGGNNTGATITVTAYAVQKAGFDSAEDAWSSTFGQA